MEIASRAARPSASSTTEAPAAAVGGSRSRSKVLATGVRISASTTAPAVGMRKSRAEVEHAATAHTASTISGRRIAELPWTWTTG